MQHPSIVKSSNWNLPKPSQYSFEFIEFNYLHGKAQEICGYDCIEANFDFTLNLISLEKFKSKLLLKDGTMVDVIVLPYIKENRISSLICLCDDYEGVKSSILTIEMRNKNVYR